MKPTIKGAAKSRKQYAEEIYFSSNLTQKDLAEIIGVSEKTIGKWVTEDEWETKKNLALASKQSAIKNLYARLLTQTTDTKVSSDEIKKTTSAIKDLQDSRTTIPDKIELYTELIKFLRGKKEVDPDMIRKINLCQNMHIQSLIKDATG